MAVRIQRISPSGKQFIQHGRQPTFTWASYLPSCRQVDSENPYSPPQTIGTDAPTAPPSFGWSIHGKVVRVTESSRLPMVDPFSGQAEEIMTQQKLRVRHMPRWLWGGAVAGMLTGLLLGGMSRDSFTGSPHYPLLVGTAVAGWVLGCLLRWFLQYTRPSCTIHAFFEKSTVRRRHRISNLLNLLFITASIGGIALGVLPPWLEWLPGSAALAFIILLTGALIFHRRLRCRTMSDGMFEIHGFHTKTLDTLAREATKSS
jgi:hypothetical protein